MAELLEIKNLSVSFDTPQGELQAVRDVSFSLHAGEVLALVGESGCGKSVLCKSIMKLLHGNARITGGSILVDGASAGQAVFHGISRPYGNAEPDDFHWRADRRGCAGPSS